MQFKQLGPGIQTITKLALVWLSEESRNCPVVAEKELARIQLQILNCLMNDAIRQLINYTRLRLKEVVPGHDPRSPMTWAQLLEAWLTQTGFKYHGNLWVLLIHLNHSLALTMLRPTQPWSIEGFHVTS